MYGLTPTATSELTKTKVPARRMDTIRHWSSNSSPSLCYANQNCRNKEFPRR
jgi:hypothetical protein